MINGFLTTEERSELKQRHRKEKDRRTGDRIKAVLLSDKGWNFRQISEALFLDEATISKHVEEYQASKKLTIAAGGSESKLSSSQTQELAEHLDAKTYLKVSEICAYVEETYSVKYSAQGMTNWLNRNGFSYRKPRPVPSKAKPEEQKAFVEKYKKIVKDAAEKDEPVLFADAVHPTMATKITCGWIRKGSAKTIDTTASRTRMNIVGGINLASMEVVKKDFKTVNGDSMVEFFDLVAEKNPGKKKIRMFLDNGPYNASKKTQEEAEKRGIVLHFLPTYSPNLNPIERLWKIMNEYVGNNRFFRSAKEFRDSINEFFEKTWTKIARSMSCRINDNFQIIKKSNVSV
jgi:transposase